MMPRLVQIVSYLKLFFYSLVLLLTACISDHPVPIDTPSALPSIEPAALQSTAKTAVLLLPLRGTFGAEGQSVRDGFLAAERSADVAQTIHVQVIDTQNEKTPQDAYQAAVSLHPDLIIGPLTKPDVKDLLTVTTLPVTTLALNQVDASEVLPLNLFTFSLSPQAEAADTAQKIAADGFAHVLLITPAGDWEQSIAAQFNQAWLDTHDEESTKTVRYDSRQTLAVALAQAIKGRSAADLKQTAVFCIVSAQGAANILPVIKKIVPAQPIYSLPMIFNGTNQSALENIIFAVSPWMLDAKQSFKNDLRKKEPTISFENIGLSAFGADAWALTQFYLETGSFENLDLSAYSGHLTVNLNNVIQRQLTWGVVKNGVLTTFAPNTEKDDDDNA